MGKTHIVLAGVIDHRLTATGGKVGLFFPANRTEFAAEGDEVTWQIRVLDVAGEPTSWSLGARFHDIIEHTTGPQYAKPELVPFTQLQTISDVVEGVGWGKPGLGKTRPNPAYDARPNIANPNYDGRQFLANPNYNASTDPRGTVLNPTYDPRGQVVNPAYDPRLEIASGLQLNAGEFGIVAQSGDALPAQVSRTVRVRSLRHKIEFAPAFTGGSSPSLGVVLTYTVRRLGA